MRITLTRAAGGHAKGDTIDRNEQVARLLITSGAATEAKQDDAETSDDTKVDEPKPKRTRRSASRKAKSGDGHDTKALDVSAGQRGGEGPPHSPAPTAG